MKNKRVLIVANTTWNIYKFRLNLVQRLLEKGCYITVVAPIDKYIVYKNDFPTVQHIDLKNMKRDHLNPIKDLLSIFELRRIYKMTKPDIVVHFTHKANIYGGLAARLTGVKSMAVVTGLGYGFLRGGWMTKLMKQFYRIVGKTHKAFLFENEDDRNAFIEMQLVPEQKARFVNGCGVDTREYLPQEKTLNQDTINFTFIGRLLRDKGIYEFVDAAQQVYKSHKKVRFDIVGQLDEGNPSTVQKSTLYNWADKSYINYKGFIEDIKPVIANSDCVVLPSYREGMPRTILEAMSMARPIITTDVPGCRQTVEEGFNGFLIPHKNASALASSMKNFINLSSDERLQMGKNGRQLAQKRYNSEKISSELYEIISQVYFCA